jgi:hypothetical protein
LPARLAAAYLAVALGLAILPRGTFNHHWIIGTPFQYVAMAFALPALKKRSLTYQMLVAAILGLFVARLPVLVEVERSLIAGRSSDGFDPGFNRLIQFAAAHSADTVFISADWGSATQLYCGSNGMDDAVFEPFWSADPAERALNIALNTRKKTLYIVTTGLSPQLAEASDSIIRAIATSAEWQAARMDPGWSEFGRIQIHKFVRKVKS